LTILQKILIVEDEVKLALVLKEYLEQAGYIVSTLHNGDEVLPFLNGGSSHSDISLLILDLMLPGTDGITLCQEIRNSSDVPIIMVTALVQEKDRLKGFEIGADDYICKPFSLREMVARVKVILRRTSLIAINNTEEEHSGELFCVELARMSISIRGHQLNLTAVEFRLLNHMLDNPQVIFSRNELLNVIYDDYRLVSDRTIDSHIKNVRKKLQTYIPEHDVIQSVYGVGYKYQLTQACADSC
jgi:two-component system response regulator BaeR